MAPEKETNVHESMELHKFVRILWRILLFAAKLLDKEYDLKG